jgi:predicted amidohydrolase
MTNASDQNGIKIALRLHDIATRAEIVERLLALPEMILTGVVAAEPAVYATIAADAGEASLYLKALAQDFANIAERLSVCGGAK